MTPQLAYSILSPLTDSQDVPLTVSLSLMCQLIDSSAMPLSRKHQIIEQTKKQLEKKTPSNYNVGYPPRQERQTHCTARLRRF